jgi:hypothetical protein
MMSGVLNEAGFVTVYPVFWWIELEISPVRFQGER